MSHRVILMFDDGGVTAKLICPADGSCKGGATCGLCGRSFNDTETEPCYDCKGADPDECWIKTWFDNEPADELIHGKVEVEIDCTWGQDHLVATIKDQGHITLVSGDTLRGEGTLARRSGVFTLTPGKQARPRGLGPPLPGDDHPEC